MKQIPEGSRITCPNKMCGIPLFEFVKPLAIGEHLSLDHINPLHNRAIQSAEHCTCPACGHRYMDNGAVHTHFGWFPYPP